MLIGDPDNIVTEYRDLQEVFNKTKDSGLPPHRPYNCAFDLLLGNTPPHGWVYALSAAEHKTMEEYSEEAL